MKCSITLVNSFANMHPAVLTSLRVPVCENLACEVNLLWENVKTGGINVTDAEIIDVL